MQAELTEERFENAEFMVSFEIKAKKEEFLSNVSVSIVLIAHLIQPLSNTRSSEKRKAGDVIFPMLEYQTIVS